MAELRKRIILPKRAQRSKMRSTLQDFKATSLRLDIPGLSGNNNGHVTDSKRLVCPVDMSRDILGSAPIDMSRGVLARGPSLSSTNFVLPPSSVLKIRQYLLNDRQDESSKKLQHDQLIAAPNNISIAPLQISQTRSGNCIHGKVPHQQGLISRSSNFLHLSRDNVDNRVDYFVLPSSRSKSSEGWVGHAYWNSPDPSTLPFPTFPSNSYEGQAGAAYPISPDPSSLPFPMFSLRPMKKSTLDRGYPGRCGSV